MAKKSAKRTAKKSSRRKTAKKKSDAIIEAMSQAYKRLKHSGYKGADWSASLPEIAARRIVGDAVAKHLSLRLGRERPLGVSDVKEMFLQIRDEA
jgi:hypothetical protein